MSHNEPVRRPLKPKDVVQMPLAAERLMWVASEASDSAWPEHCEGNPALPTKYREVAQLVEHVYAPANHSPDRLFVREQTSENRGQILISVFCPPTSENSRVVQ